MDKSPRVLHPFLFSIFPVIFLYAHNVGEVFVSQVIAPLAICLAGGVLLWGAISAVSRGKLKSGILTSLMLIGFFSYGHFFNLVDGAQIGSFKFGLHTYMLVVWTLVFALPVVFVFMTKRSLDICTKILNVIAVCLVVISAGNIAAFHFKSVVRTGGIEVSRLPDDNVVVDASKLENKPNIYYIVLDEYARADILEKEFDHDSSPFLSHLKDNGFFVSKNSRANYVHTLLSIPSSINFQYLDDVAKKCGSESTDVRPMKEMFLNNRAFKFLKDIGYTTVSFSSGYNTTELNNTDHYLKWVFIANDFVIELLDSTLLASVGKFSRDIHYARYKKLHYIFEELAETARMSSPHVVFAHILCPHEPYVLDENGRLTWQVGYYKSDGLEFMVNEQKRKYLAQLKYVDKRITQIVDDILANSKIKPVIIIQADHGVRLRLKGESDKSVVTSRNECRFAILNALHLPGFDYSKLDNNITPVNTFRFIFNHYFGTEFEILENKNFASTSPYYYKFKDVTDSLN